MSIEEKVGRLSGFVEDIKDDIKNIYLQLQKNNEDRDEKLMAINAQHDYEQKQTNEYLKSIDVKLAGIKQPCSHVEIAGDKITGHLKGHQEKQRNNLTKAGLFAGFVTLFLHIIGSMWYKMIKFFANY